MESRYLAIDVSTAAPEALVSRLLVRAFQSAEAARGVPPGAERTRGLARSLDILAELRSALDFGQGGEIAANLDRLYEFAAGRLLRAGLSSGAHEIDDALGALAPIVDAFREVADTARTRAAP